VMAEVIFAVISDVGGVANIHVLVVMVFLQRLLRLLLKAFPNSLLLLLCLVLVLVVDVFVVVVAAVLVGYDSSLVI
jgi:hypothetical protein